MSHRDKDAALEPALQDVDNIQNLDTARMALRWALERMRALEKRVEEVEGDAKRAQESSAKVSSELEGARDLLARRAGEAAERERYYAKIEEYLNLQLAGGLDAAAMARRESRIEERETELQRREIETENKIRAARQRADEETRRSVAEASAAAELRVKDARLEYEKRTFTRDAELSSRLLALHEKEAQLNTMERSLEERRKRFEEFHAAQRAAIEKEAAAIGQNSADQAEFLERRIEQALTARTSAFERAWVNDRQVLLDELAAWRAKSREHLPALLEVQSRAASLEENCARLADENRALAESKAVLAQELVRWRAEAQNDLPALLAAVRRAVESEESVKHLEVELASTQRRAEEYQAQLMSDELSHEARVKELSRLESALSSKLRDAEQDLFRQYDAWLERESELRRRDQDWRVEAETRAQSIELLRSEIGAQRDELKKAIASYRARADALHSPENQENPDE
ncbi:MAG: hypothetical protein KGJ84_04880 [Elusimicrobia bacterium]|nr:hypothetical protein [Elusimicrobiota bacterium]